MNKKIIAIDGYAATGKSTQAKRLAKVLNFTYIDTGAMYRAVTLFGFNQAPKGSVDLNLLNESLNQITIRFEEGAEEQQTFLNDANVTKAIRDPKINQYVSQVAAQEAVRTFLTEQQQLLVADKGVVMDGRDIGTVVFPHAACKFFLTASVEVRAKRRYLEQREAGVEESLDEVLFNVKARDDQDASRAIAPLQKAKDAIEIDVSNLTLEQVFDELYAYAVQKLEIGLQ
ncbi:(d)CMP kinase [Flavobacteriaceae bacterium]|nr:(d)CMP kinase [Flavobacteriaceae bacterium]